MEIGLRGYRIMPRRQIPQLATKKRDRWNSVSWNYLLGGNYLNRR
jgi:hypothetical protein